MRKGPIGQMGTDVKRVLVVEDDETIRTLVSVVLTSEGFLVETASDGLEALEVADRARPDEVLLDIQMPRCDGEAFAARLRERGERVPIVLMTAALDADERCQRLKADRCVAKPFDIDELVATVRETARGHAHRHHMGRAA